MRAGENAARAGKALLKAIGFMIGVALCLILFVVSGLLAIKWGGAIGGGIWVFCWFCAVIWTEGDVVVVEDRTKGRP